MKSLKTTLNEKERIMEEYENITIESLIGSASLSKDKRYKTFLLYDNANRKVEVYSFRKQEELRQYCYEFVENIHDDDDVIDAKCNFLYNKLNSLGVGESHEVTTEEDQIIFRVK